MRTRQFLHFFLPFVLLISSHSFAQLQNLLLLSSQDGGNSIVYQQRSNECASGVCTISCDFREFEFGYRSSDGFSVISGLSSSSDIAYGTIIFNPSMEGIYSLEEVRRLLIYTSVTPSINSPLSEDCELRVGAASLFGQASITVKRFNFTSSVPALCQDDETIDLSQNISFFDSNVTFSGAGVSGFIFDPAKSGAGTHKITASRNFVNTNGSAKATINIIVRGTDFVFDSVDPICTDNAILNLQTLTTRNTTFSGVGVSGTTFNPGAAGNGNHLITARFETNGCSTMKEITITVGTAFTANAGTNQTICQNEGDVLLSFDSPVDIAGIALWSSNNEQLNAAINGEFINVENIPPDTYSVSFEYKSNAGCTKFDSKEITVLEASKTDLAIIPSTLEANIGVPVQFSITVSEGTSALWDFGDGQISKEVSPFHYFYELGEFEVSVQTTSAGCTETFTLDDKINITGETFELITSREENVSSKILLYPNPVYNITRISGLKLNTELNLSIYDFSGKLMYHEFREKTQTSKEIDVSSLPKGMYIINVNGSTLKMLKQ